MSPETSKIVVLSWRLAEICTVSSPSRSVAGLRQILHETQLVRRPLAGELHGVHGLADPVQSQSAGSYRFELPPSQLVHVNRRTTVTKQYFESLLDCSVVTALRLSKIHGDRLVRAIAVGMPHYVGESFIDRASDRPALYGRKSQ